MADRRDSGAGDALSTNLGGVALRNPVLLAAGTAGYVDEMAGALDLSRVGGVVTKSITPEQRSGNATWRVVETCGGMLNAIGLANIGAEGFASEHAPKVAKAPCAVIGSIAGHSVEDFASVAGMFAKVDAMRAVEVNVSCPNVAGGAQFGETPAGVRDVVTAVCEALRENATAVFVKLPPVTTGAAGASIVDLASAALDAGASGLTIANTIPAMAIDVEKRTPRLANITGGLSGPAIHPVTVRLVHLVYREVAAAASAPIIGAGGVLRWRDAAELILAGATAIEMGTALFADPKAPMRVVRGLEKWARTLGASNVGELIGAVVAGDVRTDQSP